MASTPQYHSAVVMPLTVLGEQPSFLRLFAFVEMLLLPVTSAAYVRADRALARRRPAP